MLIFRWNPIISGAATGAILAVRSGPKVMLFSGILGGVFLAAMEGGGILLGKLMEQNIDPQPIVLPEAPKKEQKQAEASAADSSPISSLFKSTKFGFNANQ